MTQNLFRFKKNTKREIFRFEKHIIFYQKSKGNGPYAETSFRN